MFGILSGKILCIIINAINSTYNGQWVWVRKPFCNQTNTLKFSDAVAQTELYIHVFFRSTKYQNFFQPIGNTGT